MTLAYTEFLDRKVHGTLDHGREVDRAEIHPLLTSYWSTAVDNLRRAEMAKDMSLFEVADA